jgi:SPP1 family predicted phage head-tail adaptor
MDRTAVAYLVTQEYQKDQYGVHRETVTERKIYVQVDSVSGSEWFEGGRNGLNPEFRFTTWRFDYKGEEVIKYNGQYYQIYRTYLGRDETIELYAEKRKGNADKNQEQ